MAKYVNLKTAKAHLRVDFDEDDIYIMDLIELVEELISTEIGEDLSLLENAQGAIPRGLIQAMLILLSHYYEIREPVIVGTGTNKIPYTFEFLIAPYKNHTIS